MWTKEKQMTRARGGGGRRMKRWRNEQKDEQMKGMCTGHETAGGGKGGKGTEQIKLVVARQKV